MKKISQLSYRWLPVFIWITIIFYLSSKQRISASEVQLINFILFKTLHIIEYAILYALIFRAFYLSHKKKYSSSISLISFIFAVLYATSDEIHQTFIPSREGTIRDVFIDSIGIFIMYTLIKGNIKIVKKLL